MRIKTPPGVTFAAACLMSLVAVPGAHAQTAPGYYGTQTYQGNAYPNSAIGSYGSSAGNYAPQGVQGNTQPNPATGSYGSTTGNYAPQTYQGSPSSAWSEGTTGSTGNYSPQPSAGIGNTEVVANGPQGSLPPNWSARRNVMESEHYDRMLENNSGFRQARIRKECGPITDQQLHQECVDSFAQYEAPGASMSASGSSMSSRQSRSNYGR